MQWVNQEPAFFHLSDAGGKMAVRHLFMDFKKAHVSIRRELLYNIPTEFGLPINIATLVKMWSNETCGNVCKCENLFDMFQT
jgi:hypothetical protein